MFDNLKGQLFPPTHHHHQERRHKQKQQEKKEQLDGHPMALATRNG
jgi:hypothetical protein